MRQASPYPHDAWSTQPGEAYLTRDGIRNIKSTLTNQIFKQEMLHTYEQKSQSRDELVQEARRAIRQLTQEMAQVSARLLRLSRRWSNWLDNWKWSRAKNPTATFPSP